VEWTERSQKQSKAAWRASESAAKESASLRTAEGETFTTMNKVVAIVAVLFVALGIQCSRSFVSPVDVISGRTRVVGQVKLTNGEIVQVVQYWNQGDFYNLDLHHTLSSAKMASCVIDPDCNRISKCVLQVDSDQRSIGIYVRGHLIASYFPQQQKLARVGGIVVSCEPDNWDPRTGKEIEKPKPLDFQGSTGTNLRRK
jgi:hypothetical protein